MSAAVRWQAHLRKLIWLRHLWPLVATCFFCIIAGVVFFFWKIHQPEAVAEIALRSKIVSDQGLAKLADIPSRQAAEVVVQLLGSRTVTAYAAEQVPGYTPEEIERKLSVDSQNDTSVFQFSLQARRGDDALALARAILSRGLTVNQQTRREQLQSLQKVLIAQSQTSQKEMTDIYARVAARQIEVNAVASRQKQDALTRLLSDYRSRIADIRVSDSVLRNVLQDARIGDSEGMQAANPSGSGRFAEDPQILPARRALQEANTALAALKSRYGTNHPKVATADAELKKTKEILSRLEDEQRRKMGLQTKSNEESIALLNTEMREALDEWKQVEASEDAELAELLAKQAVQARAFESLSNRLLEIRVATEGVDPYFDIVTEPYISSRLPIKPLAFTIVLSAMAGIFLGSLIVAFRFYWRARRSEETLVADPFPSGAAQIVRQ